MLQTYLFIQEFCRNRGDTCLVNSFWTGLSFNSEIWHSFSLLSFSHHFQHLSSCNFLLCVWTFSYHILYLYKSFWFIYLPYTQQGGGVRFSTDGSGTFISCSWSGNTASTNQVSTIVSILLLSPSLDQSFISSRQSWYQREKISETFLDFISYFFYFSKDDI